jgi:predicted Zn-dependent protease
LKAILLRLLIATVIAIVVIVGSLIASERQETPVTHRSQQVEMTDAEQMQAGEEEYADVLAEHADDVISKGPRYEEVQRVAGRITEVAAQDKPAFEWEVTLLRSKQVNAYCLPGGKIVVYSSILPVAEGDAGLATVLGHEVAHATAEHAAERMYQQHVTERVINVLAGGVAWTPLEYVKIVALMGAGAEVGMILPWSREQESEADHIGLIYMARGGYDPDEAVAFWQRMDRLSDEDEPPEYASTHPSEETRIEDIRGWLPEARAEYARAEDAR